MKYALTDDAKAIKNKVNNTIISELENGGGKFTNNLNSLKGPLYNAVTGTMIQDKKAMQILAQEEGLTDTRFVTAKQAIAEGIHINAGIKAVKVVNFSVEALKDKKENTLTYEDGKPKGHMMGRTYGYFNAKDLNLGDRGKGEFSYNDNEKLEIEKNLVNRLKEMYESRKYTEEKNQKKGIETKEIKELPDSKAYENKEAYYTAATEYAVDNTLSMDGNKDLNEGEYLQGKDGKPAEKQLIPENEKNQRIEFRTKLGAALLNREIGISNEPFRRWISKPTAKQLAAIYKEHPEKLAHDINASVKAASIVKEKVMFLTRARKTREEIKKMEKEFHDNPENKGKQIPAANYYKFEPIKVNKIEDRLKKSDQFKSRDLQTEINKHINKAMKTLNTQIKSVTNEIGNKITMSKFLVDKISEARKALNLESDPRKFLKNYYEMTPVKVDGRIVSHEVTFDANIKDINKNKLTHEEIINKYANGKEGKEGLNIIEKIKEIKKAQITEITTEKVKQRLAKYAKENQEKKAILDADKEHRGKPDNQNTNTKGNQSNTKPRKDNSRNTDTGR